MNLYVMRHGQTNYNLLGLCNDDPGVDVHLTATGMRQAGQAAEQLARAPLSRIYVSELRRTRQTAEVINRFHNVPILTSPCLNDILTGFSEKTVKEYFAATGHDRYNVTPPGGESVKDFQARVLKFLDEIKPFKDQDILAVTHEEALRVFYARFNNLDPRAMLQLNFGNCEILKFTM